MDRNALLLYLQNVRDLEVARFCLRARYQKEKRSYERQRTQLEETDYWSEPESPGSLAMVLFILCLLPALFLLYVICITGSSGGILFHLFMWPPFLFLAGLSCWFLYHFVADRRNYKREYSSAVSHNQKEKERERQNRTKKLKLQEQWNARAAWYSQEQQKLNNLLNQFYSMNLIPVQFRSLSAVCYIYDYMSTSRESLTTALFDQHMEDGIRRIEAKLDSMISSLESMVYETRCIRQNSERMMAQNNHMLESLQRTEDNTLQAAQYAELSANYSKANAYFSLATYLKK